MPLTDSKLIGGLGGIQGQAFRRGLIRLCAHARENIEFANPGRVECGSTYLVTLVNLVTQAVCTTRKIFVLRSSYAFEIRAPRSFSIRLAIAPNR
jgi:hypothetical protein